MRAQGPPAMDSSRTAHGVALLPSPHMDTRWQNLRPDGPLIRDSAPWEVAETRVHVSTATSEALVDAQPPLQHRTPFTS
ncbi:unnamed protein product [Rangifer tarandus platyrhynchus]|uniref:Uncharacterized protein n=2 Tax=Rangifer tarandus platyrhynchus TaxID=3082113 RepID=A0ABN8ZG36_RANTA|nr:unnamed protein product [Rangifer tarandus platyrhynchus]CAI9707994.1 unnamed protein product [Rangifer tarandus platyrhynchus]